MEPVKVYLEIGSKRIFAGAIDWPGWSRSGRDEESALQELLAYAPRYGKVMALEKIAFSPPKDISQLEVVERAAGNATTDFGAPDVEPKADARRVSPDELESMKALLRASWKALDAAAQAAIGKELRTSPRGGGRELEGMLRHVLGADQGYLKRLAYKLPKGNDGDLAGETARLRAGVMEALERAVRGEMPERGPRGGVYWSPRYYLRRAVWHTLDHAWELEDRIL